MADPSHDDVRGLLEAAADGYEPGEPSSRPARIRGLWRRRTRRLAEGLAVTVIALAVSAPLIGLLPLGSADLDPRPAPASDPEAPSGTYVFSDVRVGPQTSEPADLVVSFNVDWVGAQPGVHRCVFRAFDSSGALIGQQEGLEVFPERTRQYFQVPGNPSDAVLGDVACDADRLDEEGVADVREIDHIDSIDALEEEYRLRLEEWAKEFDFEATSVERLAGNMVALTSAITTSGDHHFTVWRQLSDRRHYLCVRLPADHPFRGGEYCD